MSIINASLAQTESLRDNLNFVSRAVQKSVQGTRRPSKLSAAEVTAVNAQLAALKTILDAVVAA